MMNGKEEEEGRNWNKRLACAILTWWVKFEQSSQGVLKTLPNDINLGYVDLQGNQGAQF